MEGVCAASNATTLYSEVLQPVHTRQPSAAQNPQSAIFVS